MWKGEKGMEQFEVQMNSFTVTQPVSTPVSKSSEVRSEAP
jgi:hypothetical protein